MLRLAVAIWGATIITLPLWSQSPPKIDASSQPAVEALRGIVRKIKDCPQQTHAESHWGKGPTEIYRTLVGPPTNVTWDVTPSNSVRAPYVGYVELTTTWDFFVPLDTFSKFSRKYPAWMEYSLKQRAKPREWRYDFDLGPDGLELTKVFYRDEKNGEWQPGPPTYCWGDAAKKGQTIVPSASH